MCLVLPACFTGENTRGLVKSAESMATVVHDAILTKAKVSSSSSSQDCQHGYPAFSTDLVPRLLAPDATQPSLELASLKCRRGGGLCLIPLSPIPLCSDPASIVTRGILLFVGLGSSRMPLSCPIASETPLAASRSSFGPFNVLWVLHSDH